MIIHGLNLAAVYEAIAVDVHAVKLLARLFVLVLVVRVRVLGDVLMLVRDVLVLKGLVPDSGRLHLHDASEEEREHEQQIELHRSKMRRRRRHTRNRYQGLWQPREGGGLWYVSGQHPKREFYNQLPLARMSPAAVKNDAMAIRKQLLAKTKQLCTAAPAASALGGSAAATLVM